MCIVFVAAMGLLKPFSVVGSLLYIKNIYICFISAALA